MLKALTIIAVATLQILHEASGHGRLMDPPGRASAWRFGFLTPRNYDDNALFCGGFARQQSAGGKCGVCGDPWDGERENEAGGKFATGTIVKTYKKGQVITAKAEVTANHNGWFEYRICPNNNPKKAVTHECLDKHVLQLADGSGYKFMVTPGVTGMYSTQLKLPDNMVCTQCVLQWKYHAANSWGIDQKTGKGCVGCGAQEEFYGCADVQILGDDNGSRPKVQTNPPVTQAPVTLPPRTMPPATNPPITKPPATIRPETMKPVSMGGKVDIGHVAIGVSCHGINNWANNTELDKWCTTVCNQGNCPPLACDCGNTLGGVTTKPTTKAPTTTTSSTTSSTTTTTRPTTTTTTTTTPRPTTTSTTTRPTTTTLKTTTAPTTAPSTAVHYQTHVVCKAVNLWAGNEYLDRWCSDACARGNCPESSCECKKVRIDVTPEVKTTATPVVQHKKICSAIDVWKGIDVFDRWCTEECNKGNCPANACTCVESRANQNAGHIIIGTTATTYGNCRSLSGSQFWDDWCVTNCKQGKCARDFCNCN